MGLNHRGRRRAACEHTHFDDPKTGNAPSTRRCPQEDMCEEAIYLNGSNSYVGDAYKLNVNAVSSDVSDVVLSSAARLPHKLFMSLPHIQIPVAAMLLCLCITGCGHS
ncbi:hypothetical protein PF005_g10579 [Phytophthora fragariae]|uniref:Uncharacterized protein n=1 Tax=Phytophthora fragariae TaxID=53985 RepID=A0A6A3L575_9STRA|nr:hypothetical protein PF009_g12016 [Phytophthora fragariae]KAE9010783.1 hypothetical protein PF011_g9674 [Phytophthora fragariae]KAE9113173.1 hypothetical protein PF007_g10823 [Phytophthora fragariae]KAE9148393.1 hypothetical protein PF006_g6998 [Phytophthora fragariae]KAE9212469.1 hypothetical protein PF005_g10579 [Phytophthora fragariae]